ncbi:GntR family transcriptional regulator [Aerococcus agrisoli]|uniref:GntR family transcriptional regulator n=1 Tax=Aerococcus agrisoli TaxID=2487350 RepID=A0A3N4G0G0_9LACT|nr:GntR family transcriptional regulator [Aerococcus agrisoli]RPA55935.1 GntR family transcriptional regulator [Aerococcus agrisoli]
MNKYEEIANELRRRINDGEYAEGEMLPDQIELAKEFCVSRMTLKKGIDMIAMEGLIIKKRGVGTFVLKSTLWNNGDSKIDDYQGLTQQFGHRKIVSKKILFDIVFPNEELQKLLLIEASDPVYHVQRLRIIDNKPYILEDSYFVASIITQLKEEHLYGSIYAYIRDELGLKIGGAYRKIHADVPGELDIQELNCDEHTPVLEVEQVVYLENGTPFEYSTSRNRYDTRSYTMTDIVGRH